MHSANRGEPAARARGLRRAAFVAFPTRRRSGRRNGRRGGSLHIFQFVTQRLLARQRRARVARPGLLALGGHQYRIRGSSTM
ncbi:MAG: hypothetical protein ACMG6H_04830 [Acidobacteriota bacterium]